MGQEEYIYNLTLLDPALLNSTNASKAAYFCSFVYYVDLQDAYYRITPRHGLDKIDSLCNYADTFSLVMVWICLILGLPGNVASIATIATMPRSTGAFYILVLAASDLVAMIIRSVDHLFRYYDFATKSGLCRFWFLATNYSTIYANWILVLICVERFVTVKFPLQKRYYYTRKTARVSIIVLALLLIPFGIVDYIAIEAPTGKCEYVPSFQRFYDIWIHVVNSFYAFIPATLILVFVLLVMHSLRKQQYERSLIMKDDTGGENSIMKRQRLEARRTERAITMMMFFAFVIFLVISIPVCIVITITSGMAGENPVLAAEKKMLMKLTSALTLLSHAVNFYIYFLSTRNFRTRLFAILKRCPCCVEADGEEEERHTELNEI